MDRIRWRLRGLQVRVLKLLARVPPFRRMLHDTWLEYALCRRLVPERLRLESVQLSTLFPQADSIGIMIDRLPEGGWRTGLDDVVLLLKLARLTLAKRVLELGSYRGVTAAYLAQNLPADGMVVAVDIDPDHGAIYRGTELEARIERRTGAIEPTLFETDRPGSYDLIFVDASHDYDDVRRDSEIAIRLVAPQGHVVWHDYSNYGYFNGHNDVPEFLIDFSATRTIVNLAGSTLAIHSPAWRGGWTGTIGR